MTISVTMPCPYHPQQTAARHGDYLTVRAEPRPQREGDLYYWYRAHLLGGTPLPPPQDECFVSQFLRIQHRIFLREDLFMQSEALLRLGPKVPDCRFFRGEFHFVLGYALNLQNAFASGCQHHRLASEFYGNSWPTQRAIALYNLCIALGQLNQRTALETAMEELAAIRDASPPAHLHYHRLAGHEAMNAQQYSTAWNHFLESFSLATRLHRPWDRGSAFFSLWHCSQLLALVDGTRLPLPPLPPLEEPHGLAMELGREMETMGFEPWSILKDKIRRWQKTGIEPIHLLSILSVLAERLHQFEEFESLFGLSRWAGAFAVRNQQSPNTWEFRYFEGMALLKMGEVERSRRILASYSGSPNSELRTKRAAHWKKQMGEDSTVLKSVSLVLDVDSHTLKVDDCPVALRSKPTIERLLLCLAEGTGPVPVPQAFAFVYGETYRPNSHERRWNSLLDRTRKLLPVSELILRRGGHVELARRVQVEVLRPSPDLRRRRLLQKIRQAKDPVPLSQLVVHFDQGKRTLQGDLNVLLRNTQIIRIGSSRSTRYQEVTR